MRLERFSGARLLIDKDVCQVEGNPTERELAKLAISITLQQRNGGQVTTDFEELEDREDVSTLTCHRRPSASCLAQRARRCGRS